MEFMDALFGLAIFLVVWFLLLPRIPGLSRFT